VAGAGISGAHRNSHEKPEALVPGEVYKLDYDLHFTSWVFPKGHRIRLAVNNALWPMIWPTPYKMTTSLGVDGRNASRIVLPVVPESDRIAPDFQPPVEDPELPGYGTLQLGDETDSGYAETRRIERRPLMSQTRVIASGKSGWIYPWATMKYSEEMIHEAQDTDPGKARVTGRARHTVELGERTLIIETDLSFTSDADNFYYTYSRRILENGKLIREKTWKETIPRVHH
jgi:hypothetical protein